MAYQRLLQLRESYQSHRAPTPLPSRQTVDQALQDIERQTRRLQQQATHDQQDGRQRTQRPAINNRNRYARSSPTEDERDRALDEHAERVYQRKLQTQMFGEDRSTSKLYVRRGKKVRAPEKIREVERERHFAVPLNHDHQRLRMTRTTAMFGDDLSKKSSKSRRAPPQPSLVSGQNGAENTQYRMYPDEDEEAVYVTLEEVRHNGRKQAATRDVPPEKTATKLPALAPQRPSLTVNGTAAAINTSGRPSRRNPKPAETAKSDNAMATEKQAVRRRTRGSRPQKRRCESPSGPAQKH
ncbi:PREDICTED: uncharacterized protein LOC109481155 [Branchiostoma belcheri]|uniref:Uncharacterized protein LOC109481155 n=1 Tax=Branchiostoma belcheri TaxID=7741 RepID=A0A6P5ABQ4_BRABE|nr:PREDICTED: uncharacterized protein LOC109481155 [Branchiostoma belcheri]